MAAELHLALTVRAKTAAEATTHEVDSLPTVVREADDLLEVRYSRVITSQPVTFAVTDFGNLTCIEAYEIVIREIGTASTGYWEVTQVVDTVEELLGRFKATPSRPVRIVMDGLRVASDDEDSILTGFTFNRVAGGEPDGGNTYGEVLVCALVKGVSVG